MQKKFLPILFLLVTLPLTAQQTSQKVALGIQGSLPLGGYRDLVTAGMGLEEALVFTIPMGPSKISLDAGGRLYQTYFFNAGNQLETLIDLGWSLEGALRWELSDRVSLGPWIGLGGILHLASGTSGGEDVFGIFYDSTLAGGLKTVFFMNEKTGLYLIPKYIHATEQDASLQNLEIALGVEIALGGNK